MVHSLSMSLAVLATLLLATLSNGLAISYCSSDNTASNQAGKQEDLSFHFDLSLTQFLVYSSFQSNGLCQTTCSGYAYAVLQGGNCWCSDYAPANQVTTYDCNEQCPGYPYDWCGSQSAGLFGYYQLSVAPSGTAGGATPASSSSVSFTSSTSGPPFHSFSFASAPSSASVSSSVVVATPVYSTDSSTSATTV